jgi:hypothetical protein
MVLIYEIWHILHNVRGEDFDVGIEFKPLTGFVTSDY